MKRGLFITLEGNDGAGKTTMAKKALEYLQKKGYRAIYTREPGGSMIAEKIRTILLDPENTKMDAITEAILYAASRRQHLVEVVLPALEEGTIVLCDRFIDSSLAYQGEGRKLGWMRSSSSINSRSKAACPISRYFLRSMKRLAKPASRLGMKKKTVSNWRKKRSIKQSGVGMKSFSKNIQNGSEQSMLLKISKMWKRM